MRSKTERRREFLFLLIIVAAVSIYSFVGSDTGSVTCQVDSDSGVLGVSANGEFLFIQISDIINVELLDSIEVSEEVEAEAALENVYCGTYVEKNYGECTIMAYKDSEEYLCIVCADQTVLISMSRKNLTEDIYDDIQDAML